MCDMLVPWRPMNGTHRRTTQYKKGAEQKRRNLSEEEERAVTSRAFSVYVRPLDMVTSLKYLGRAI